MIEVTGKYTSAIIYSDTAEQGAIDQIQEVCNSEFASGSKIRVMPDIQEGNGCTIGTSMTITDKVVPAMVGVDICCGVRISVLEDVVEDLPKLDQVIRERIPSGFNSRDSIHPDAEEFDLSRLACADKIPKLQKAMYQLGTLGGGNHMIELNQNAEGTNYLVIHSGSRNLGKQVADYYQKLAEDILHGQDKERIQKARDELKARLKAEKRDRDIGQELAKLKREIYNKDLCYLEGENMEDYLNDCLVMEEYANTNRMIMMNEILEGIGAEAAMGWTTLHNYVDTDNMILRKGAISAREGELVIIPMNMRDGSIIAKGKGNPDWNISAPHGAGRIMSRKRALKAFALEDFQREMEGIYSTSVSKETLDESPFVYKPMDEILKNIEPTAEVVDVIKPRYNFKAS